MQSPTTKAGHSSPGSWRLPPTMRIVAGSDRLSENAVTVSSQLHQQSLERPRRPLRAPDALVHQVTTSDGVPLRLTRYRGGSRGPVLLVHGLGVSSRIFRTDTIATNLVEFLCDRGFDVWLADLRVSVDLPSSDLPSTADDVATKDFPALMALVRYVTGAKQVDALVHCYGATTFFMSVLAGLAGVRSIVASQVAAHAVVPWRMRLEALSGFPTLLRLTGLGSVSVRPNPGDPLERMFDGALGAMPFKRTERCQSATCRRITFLYGRLYQHDQLSPETHDALPELFGRSSVRAFEQLAAMVRHGRLVTAAGRDEYLGQLDRLAMPVTFIHGELNKCYLPASTAATHELLRAKHGDKLYERHVVPRYGHIDCIFGKNAAQDVYPLMLRHLDRVGS